MSFLLGTIACIVLVWYFFVNFCIWLLTKVFHYIEWVAIAVFGEYSEAKIEITSRYCFKCHKDVKTEEDGKFCIYCGRMFMHTNNDSLNKNANDNNYNAPKKFDSKLMVSYSQAIQLSDEISEGKNEQTATPVFGRV